MLNNKIDMLKVCAGQIKAYAERIESELKNVDYDSLYNVEILMRKIENEAGTGNFIVLDTYDELEEG